MSNLGKRKLTRYGVFIDRLTDRWKTSQICARAHTHARTHADYYYYYYYYYYYDYYYYLY